MDHAIHNFAAFADLRGGVWKGYNGQIFELVCAFDVRIRTHVDIFDNPGIFNDCSVANLYVKYSFRSKFLLCDF